MEKLNVGVGYGKNRESEDLNFNDVFGGPPRRFSLQEVRERYSFGESEKPVFREERRHRAADFFDDIFKGAHRDHDHDHSDSVFGDPPLPANFSLPAKLSKAMDFPTFGSHNHGQYKVDGLNNPQYSWSASLSRFSNEASRSLQDELNKDESVSEDSPSPSPSPSPSKDVDSIGNQFHFSIYKWAGRGVPMLTPLVIGNHFKSKGHIKYEKSESSNGRMESKSERKQQSKSSSVVFNRGEQVKSVDETNVGEKIEKQVPVKPQVLKPPHAFIVEGETKDSKKMKEEGRKGVVVDSAKGKVKEFVQIFNQEAEADADADVQGSRSSRINEVSSNPAKVKQVNLQHNVVENLKNDEAHAQQGFSSHTGSTLRKSFSAGMVDKDLKMAPENLDDLLEDNFVVHELSDVTQKESSEERKAIDAKIRQWSVGKTGNIRSLLSTLQYVLWAESGWKAVPLVDLIEANSVKRAYQKALLRLHPDKLQQKGADFNHKYIAEKVFDILQEAWDHFNTCSSLGIS